MKLGHEPCRDTGASQKSSEETAGMEHLDPVICLVSRVLFWREEALNKKGTTFC